MNELDQAALDRHITGNWGEDSVPDDDAVESAYVDVEGEIAHCSNQVRELDESIRRARHAVRAWTSWAELHMEPPELPLPALSTCGEEFWEKEQPGMPVGMDAGALRRQQEAADAYAVAGVYRSKQAELQRAKQKADDELKELRKQQAAQPRVQRRTTKELLMQHRQGTEVAADGQ